MARGNIREYLRGDIVWQKEYFYVLRPLLAMLWIEKDLGPVPIEFGRLVDATVSGRDVREKIDELLRAKKAGAELNRGPRIAEISRFIEIEVERLGKISVNKLAATAPVEQLNNLFREVLREAWRDALPTGSAQVSISNPI
jgi:predicted nucleotidyltransferase